MLTNVLVTSVAAKVQLIESLTAACKEYDLCLYATDISIDSPALYFADGYVLLPKISDDGYLDALLQFCHAQQIGHILPTRDQDLIFFSAHRSRLSEQGIALLMSDDKTIAICSDKHAFHSVCQAKGLPVLPRMIEGELQYPCVAKEVYSSAGSGVHFLKNASELENLLLRNPGNYLFEPHVPYDEYTIDAFYDIEGLCVQAVPRKRILVVGGESKVSRVVENPILVELAHRLGEHFSFFGHVTIQAFYQDGKTYLVEINPRFGGASNLSIVAGLASPRKLIATICDDMDTVTQVNPIQYGLKMLRYTKDLMIQDDIE